MYKWNLESLYKGLDDSKFISDTKLLDEKIEVLNNLAKKLNEMDKKDALEKFVLELEAYQQIAYKLFSFISLTLATDSTNKEFNNRMVVLRSKVVNTTLAITLFEKFIANIDNLDDVISSSELLNEYKFFLNEIKEDSIHLLTEDEEVLAALLGQSGGSLYSKMQGDLTSTLEVDYRGEKITLPKVRNLAYEADPEVRRDAYFAELEAYKKIEKPTSFALNGIKKEVITMTRRRKYSSPLDRTLKSSRINEQVLNTLIQAMEESLVDFRRYLKQKAKILNHENGLPFYDLFAPIGGSDKKYSVEEAQEYILTNFKKFSSDLYEMADRAFKENWIDYLPYPGKRGGAFCSGLYPIKESRIMLNFDGSIGDISTLAHELGHAYHNLHIFNERLLNTSYPMPIAETASILCETIVKQAVLKEATNLDEKIGILEQELQDSTQVIVDILSRFYFEKEVFKRCESEFLDENELNKMMIDAQKQTYGDGLNSEFLNSGMWINKGHYYSTGRSFYNFPYAFGLLFAKGIYAKYQQLGDSFVIDLQSLLRNSGKANLMDVAASINIDITDINFWRASIDVIKKDIDLFIELTNK